MDHLSDDTLLEYLDSDDKTLFADESLHLAACVICRRRLAQLKKAKELLSQSQIRQQHVEGLEGNESKFSGLEQRLVGVDGLVLLDEIKEDPLQLKAALHAITHEQAMSSALATSEPASVAPVADSPLSIWLAKAKQWLNHSLPAREPSWVTNGGIAAFLLVGVVMFAGVFNIFSDQHQLAYYQDAPGISFSNDNIPDVGVGFFAAANSMKEPFAGITVTDYDGDEIQLEWPSVEGAKFYTIEIVKIRSGVSSVVAKKQLSGDKLVGTTDAIQTAELSWQTPMTEFEGRYEWVLSGQTEDQRRFAAQGGFVISNAR